MRKTAIFFTTTEKKPEDGRLRPLRRSRYPMLPESTRIQLILASLFLSRYHTALYQCLEAKSPQLCSARRPSLAADCSPCHITDDARQSFEGYCFFSIYSVFEWSDSGVILERELQIDNSFGDDKSSLLLLLPTRLFTAACNLLYSVLPRYTYLYRLIILNVE